MLGTQERQTYLELLRPPDGFQFDRAIGSTYSLDLMALLVLPLSCAGFELDDAGEAVRDPVALLEALRRYASRITVFCQQGQIHVPSANHLLFSYLEPMVVEARAPHPEGSFHAKTWLLRFVRPEKKTVHYRFLCLSRNLTFAHSWDTVFSVEGELTQRKLAFRRMNPLGDFFAALPSLAVRPLSKDQAKFVGQMQREIRRTRFKLAPPFEDEELRFWPLGIPGHHKSPFQGRMDRIMIISPFLSDAFLESMSKSDSSGVLISRSDSLQGVTPQTLERFEEVFVVDESATDVASSPPGTDAVKDEKLSDVVSEAPSADRNEVGEDADDHTDGFRHPAGETEEAVIDTEGLHTKLYLAKAGWKARLWTGSANATVAALPSLGGKRGSQWGRNVEFLVELQGRWSQLGIDTFLEGSDGRAGFRDFLRPFTPGAPPSEEEQLRMELQDQLKKIRFQLLQAKMRLEVSPGDAADQFSLKLVIKKPWPNLGSCEIRIWPVTQRPESARFLDHEALQTGLTFPTLLCASLTSFIAFELIGKEQGIESRLRFVLNLPLKGLPADRDNQVLRAVLVDKDRFLRLLLLLLAEERDPGSGIQISVKPPSDGGKGTIRLSQDSIPLLEELVRALARAPEKIERIQKLVAELKETSEGCALLPDGFDEVWKPIERAWRERIR